MKRLIGVLLIAFILASCASAPQITERFPIVTHVEPLPQQPGDEELVYVPLGTLRQAVYTDEAYAALIKKANEDAATANRIIAGYNELAKRQAQVKFQAILFSVVTVGTVATIAILAN